MAAYDFSSRILLHSPDITLKGKNQEDFQNALGRNIKRRLAAAGIVWPVYTARGRAYVDTTGRDSESIIQALSVLQEMAGVSSLAAASWLRPKEMMSSNNDFNWGYVEAAIVEIAKSHYSPNASFALQVNRVDKRLPFTSQELEVRLGNVIRDKTDWENVLLKNPDRTFYIDAYPDGLYLYGDKLPGIGGLPVGTGGRVLALLSGGIDSPVAAFLLAKRGCHVDFFHLSAGHLQVSEYEKSVITRLAQLVSRYTLRSRLYIAPYTYFDLSLQDHKRGYELVLLRRFMMRCAQRLAGRIKAAALVTGDSLGQVASQTIENLVTTSVSINMPVFRPLIGFNKQEIISLAQKINTYKTSIEPYKDCCALLAKHPKTRSTDELITRVEDQLFDDYDKLIETTFADLICLEFECGELTG